MRRVNKREAHMYKFVIVVFKSKKILPRIIRDIYTEDDELKFIDDNMYRIIGIHSGVDYNTCLNKATRILAEDKSYKIYGTDSFKEVIAMFNKYVQENEEIN